MKDYSYLDADSEKAYEDFTVSDIVEHISELEIIREEMKAQQEKLDLLAQREKHIAEIVIPEAMLFNGLPEVTLRDGRKVRVKEDVYASAGDQEALESLLLAHGADTLIKFQIELGGLTKQQRTNVVERVREMALDFKTKQSVHSSQLSAWVRDTLGLRVTDDERLEGIKTGRYLTDKQVEKAIKLFRKTSTTITKR